MQPQPGVFALGTRFHHFLEFDVTPEADDRSVIGALSELRGPHVSGGAVNLVVGFGPDLWRRIQPGVTGVPGELGPFVEVVSPDGHRSPATQHDVWVWVHGAGTDTVLDCAVAAAAILAPIASVAIDQPAFVYHDSRDLTGFIDGTANPTPAEAPDEACVPAEVPGAGGSYVLTQRWVHDLASFEALDIADQERVIGRTKHDSVALAPDAMPPDAHVALAEIADDDGNELAIYRRSVPFGSVAERGLYFLAFSRERSRFDAMFAQLYGHTRPGLRDRLLDFSTPVSGSYFFAPSATELTALGIGDDSL